MTSPTLLLIHGLGATSGVWADLLNELEWPGRVINADLPGHGAAPPHKDYSVGAMAVAVGGQCESAEPVIAVGHSLGGAVALCLASGFFRPAVTAAIGIGIKLAWTDADVKAMAKVADKGVRWFATRDEAIERFLLQAGLRGVADSDHPAVANAVAEVDGQWRVAQDPSTFAQRPVNAAGLVNAAACPVILGAGELDAMVSHADMAARVDKPRIATGCGHNVQIENPSWVASLIKEATGQ
ncbi:MAG: pimeloyl-ACP methyl ester carboxylesterase [Paracrocinitomix sp.]|jgi:pimeloyl-ACP methyl ester carboxylesterase